MKKYFIALLILLFACPVWGATYYFDTSCTDTYSGSATPDGTAYDPATPACTGGSSSYFVTIDDLRALNLTGGDTVYFRRGQTWRTLYTAEFDTGTDYDAFGTGNDPIIEGSVLVTTWGVYSGNVYTASFTSCTSDSAEMLWEDGTMGNRETSIGAVDAAGDFFYDDPNNLIYYWSTDNADPDTHTINFGCSTYASQIKGDNGTVQNFTIRYAPKHGMINIYGTVQDGWVVSDVVFTKNNGAGFGQLGSSEDFSVAFTDCEFSYNAEQGLVLAGGVDNTVITGGSTHHNTQAGMAIVTSSPSSGNIIQRVTAYNNGSDGIGFSAPANTGDGDEIIQYCKAYDNATLTNDRTGIKSFSERTIIRYNISYDNGDTGGVALSHGIQLDAPGSEDCEVYGNIVYGNASSGISITGSGHKIYNNIAFGNLDEDGAGGGITVFGTGPFTGVVIKNNILVDNGQTGVPGSRYQLYDAGDLSSPTIDYNLYYDSASHTNLIYFNSTNYATVAAFVSGTTYEDNGVEDNPDFVDSSSGNFELQPVSPAISQGDSLEYDKLLHGASWPDSVLTGPCGNGCEIGAYEYPIWGIP